MTKELIERVMKISADLKHLKESILSLEKYKWHHIGLTVSAIAFAGLVLVGVGGLYFSLDYKISAVEARLETQISEVETKLETRISEVEVRISEVEDQMQAGFAELKALILRTQNGEQVARRSG